MATLKEHLFQEYASKGLDKLRSELCNKYKPKKDNRFDYKGITYEISPAMVSKEGIEFEISSKIPQEQFSANVSKEKYFKSVKNIMLKKGNPPYTIDMENITTSLSQNEKKRRDYVKLKYIYSEDELYDIAEIGKRADKFKKNPADIPLVSGVATIFGKLVLLSIEDTIYKSAKENMLLFIDANEEIRKKYSKENI